jgi:crossover junction endodeoxyribonuclease RuvC
LRQLYRDLQALLRDLRPQLVVLEDLFVHHRFPRTALVLGHVRGIIMLAAAAEGVRVVELPPSSVKQAVAGTGRATKVQVQHGVRRLLGVRRVTNAHAADALALAYAGWVRTKGMSGDLVRSVAPGNDGRGGSGALGRRPPGSRR